MNIFFELHKYNKEHFAEISAIAAKHRMGDAMLASMATFELGLKKGEAVVALAEKAGVLLAEADDSMIYGIKKNLERHASKDEILKWIKKLIKNEKELEILTEISSTVASDIARHLHGIADALWQKSVYGNH